MKNRLMKKTTLAVFLLLVSSIPAYGEISKGKFATELNFPGVGVRYFLTDKFCVEGRGQFDKDIVVAGMRFYRYFNTDAKYLFFAGLEGDYISFKGEESEGSGIAGELLIGGEYFFARKFSFQMDFGPAYIYLKDKESSVSVGGIEYVVNFGINYYFGK